MTTQADIDKLTTKLTQAKSTSVDGLRVDQHSASEIMRAIEFCQNQQAVADSSTRRPWQYNFYRPPGAT